MVGRITRATINGTPVIIDLVSNYTAKRGVNSAGADFGTRYTTTYYDTDASFAFYKSRGHNLIRIPFLWEHIQPSLNGPLDSGELAALTAAVTSTTSRGMTAVLDVHNYARYETSDTTVHVMGDGFLTGAHMADLWSRLAAAFKTNPLVEFGLMNEPYDLVASVQLGASLVSNGVFASGVAGWSASNGTLAFTSGQGNTAAGAAQLTASGASIASLNSTSIPVTAGTSYQMSGSFKAATATKVTFVQATWFDASGSFLSVSDVGFTSSSTTSWTTQSGTVIAPTGAMSCVVIATIQTPGANEIHYIDDVTFQPVTSGTSAYQVWEQAAQLAVTAIRATGATNFIWVTSADRGLAASFWSIHPNWFITDPLNRSGAEAHYYFTATDGSVNYAQTTAIAQSSNYADVPSMIQAQLGVYITGAQSRGLKMYVSEIGWQNNSADIAAWNAAGHVAYQALDAANANVTQWAAGERWGSTYLMSMYTGTPQSTPTAIAATVESHGPSSLTPQF